MSSFRQSFLRAIALLVGVVGLALPSLAHACGGFFCNLQNPIEQAAERVLYITGGGKVTAHIQIRYDGPSAQFSWVLPLPNATTPTIGSDAIFTTLEATTAPRYYLQQEYGDEKCHFNQCMYMADAGGRRVPGTTNDHGSSGVTVLLQEAVGPYDSVVIKGKSGAEIKKWLDDNKYGQPKGAEVLLDAYAKQDYVFLALKLQQDKTAGDLQPIVITVDETGPCLPIRLTQIAAKPDMPIITWVLGEHRAIPKNYLHVQINEKTLDWFTGGGNYQTVASQAVDLASGHAFLTEFAGKTAQFQNQFAQPQWDAGKLAGLTNPGAFLEAMLMQNLPRTSQMQDLIRKYIPKPAAYKDLPDQQFYGCVQSQCGAGSCGDPCDGIKKAIAGQPFDAQKFADDVQKGLIAPLQDAQKSFDSHAYLTRLFTLLSPEEMTKDPIFAFNPDLPDVANQHTAKASPVCAAGSALATSAKITYADESTLTLPLPASYTQGCGGGPIGVGIGGGSATSQDGKGPLVKQGGLAARRIEVLDESGAALVVDQSAADQVDAQLNAAQTGKASLPEDFKKALPPVTWNPDKVASQTPGAGAGVALSSGCTANPTSPTSPWSLILLGLLALPVLLRRRSEV
jgi:hypothetical protein